MMKVDEKLPNYDEECGKCRAFLENFKSSNNDSVYQQQLQEIANRERQSLQISLEHLNLYSQIAGDANLLENILGNTWRYLKLFAEAADAIMPLPTNPQVPMDVFDVLMKSRLEREAEQRRESMIDEMWSQQNQQVKQLARRFDVFFITGEQLDVLHLRKVQAEHIGKTVKVKGIVTHVSDVKPLLSVAVYLDHSSGREVFQEVNAKTFMPLTQIQQGEVHAELQLQTKGSKFIKYQEAQIQECNDEVPEGGTPRTLVVRFRGEMTRTVKPGDEVALTGIFLPEPNTGFKRLKAGLVTSTYLEVLDVHQTKHSYTEHTLTEEEREDAQIISEDPNSFERLTMSIAPEIFGHVDVKKALLLAMVGGNTKKLSDGMKLRGDIHLCLMGDPGVAKSQLLKHICRISPRAVYTTGKGTSGVGLMAAVIKDAMTGELVLEGGAVVLADRGICCIDEFDKMEEGDRTAIHEVMEQQSMSIAKAGIATTLNTRTTIVSAANPAYGRYDVNRSPEDNIAMPAALLSRFDLLWLILDQPDRERDANLAQHVLMVHKEGQPPQRIDAADLLTPQQLRNYISLAKQYEPILPDDMYDYIATRYVSLREQEQKQKKPSTYTTPRTLMSLLRLATAHAKLRFSESIEERDINEAMRLVRMSKASIDKRRGDGSGGEKQSIHDCFDAIKELISSSDKDVFTANEIKQKCRGFSDNVVKQTLEEYDQVGVISIEGNVASWQFQVHLTDLGVLE